VVDAVGCAQHQWLPSVILLLGPTASGKTDVALRITERLPVEIVSVDSAQVYRQMDIGSAKPSAEVLNSVPHWLINVADPSEIYSAAKFVDDARGAIVDIVNRGKIPLLVGGSMMYFHVLLSGLNELPAADMTLRSRLKARVDAEGIESLYRQLQEVDALTAKGLHPHQGQRIQRALEVFEITGQPLSSLSGSSVWPVAKRPWVVAPANRGAFFIDDGARTLCRGASLISARRFASRVTCDTLCGLPPAVGLY
jgi:tRNA dimethylallyltransferase